MASLVIPTTLDGSHTMQQEDKKAALKMRDRKSVV